MSAPNPPEPDFTTDPYWGIGGRYTVDADGRRVPVPDVPADPEPVTPELPAKKGK